MCGIFVWPTAAPSICISSTMLRFLRLHFICHTFHLSANSWLSQWSQWIKYKIESLSLYLLSEIVSLWIVLFWASHVCVWIVLFVILKWEKNLILRHEQYACMQIFLETTAVPKTDHPHDPRNTCPTKAPGPHEIIYDSISPAISISEICLFCKSFNLYSFLLLLALTSWICQPTRHTINWRRCYCWS